MPSSRSFCSGQLSVELITVAAMPRATSASTWSFISAIKGEITSVTPPKHRAGIWKQSDLPPPVGITTSPSRPETMSVMTSSWPSKKPEKPKYRFNASCGVITSFLASVRAGDIAGANQHPAKPQGQLRSRVS